jgi:hypothetical protein
MQHDGKADALEEAAQDAADAKALERLGYKQELNRCGSSQPVLVILLLCSVGAMA